MSITINAKGTSVPFFKIGKAGVTLYQGDSDPSETYTTFDGDYWFDSASKAIKVWSSSAWAAPQIGDLLFSGSTITAPDNTDIVFQTNGVNTKVTFSGDTGPGIITASGSQDLYIDPTLGGGTNLILIDNQWPTTDGSANQVLVTNGSGVLSFQTQKTIGSASPATDATTGFGYIPVTTGTPTGTPAAITGFAPIVADSGGSKLWIYIGGAWKSATLS